MNLSALLESPVQTTGNPCVIQRTINGLPEEYQTAVVGFMELSHRDGGLTDEEIWMRFKAAGLKGSSSVINRHRRGRCGCPTGGTQ